MLPQGSVTSPRAVEQNDPANVIQATQFFVLNANLLDAFLTSAAQAQASVSDLGDKGRAGQI